MLPGVAGPGLDDEMGFIELTRRVGEGRAPRQSLWAWL